MDWCERTKLISKVESKSQLIEQSPLVEDGCERTKLISKVESKSQLILMNNAFFCDVKELS